MADLGSFAHRARVADMVNASLLRRHCASKGAQQQQQQGSKSKARSSSSSSSSAAAAAAALGDADVGPAAAVALDRPLLEQVLVQLAAAREALKDAKADGRGSPFRLPALG